MEKNKKNEELQSRRQFFKKAAKSALPILGAIVLTTAPSILTAAEGSPMGCSGYCSQHCSAGCASSCTGCGGGCKGCTGTCENACARGCSAYCNGLGRHTH